MAKKMGKEERKKGEYRRQGRLTNFPGAASGFCLVLVLPRGSPKCLFWVSLMELHDDMQPSKSGAAARIRGPAARTTKRLRNQPKHPQSCDGSKCDVVLITSAERPVPWKKHHDDNDKEVFFVVKAWNKGGEKEPR